MNKKHISMQGNKNGTVTLLIDNKAYAGIHYNKKNILVYISKRLTTDLNEVSRIFSSPEFPVLKTEINPTYLKRTNESWFAKVYFDINVSINHIMKTIVAYDENTSSEEVETNLIVFDFDEIEKKADELKLDGIDKKAFVKTRVNQSVFRNRLLRKYQKCCLCSINDASLLVASHIKPWADSKNNPQERTDVHNGLLLCPNHDKLFDNGLISFDVNGNIMISSSLSVNTRDAININKSMNIPIEAETEIYMKYH